MSRILLALLTSGLLVWPTSVRAGLHYSEEGLAELPSQWRGFLLDQRALRLIAVKPVAQGQASPARTRYEQEAGRLQQLSRERELSADELADLGALLVRLGEAGKALDVLRPAYRKHPLHYRVAANLGTAWQMQGDLDQAEAALQQAARLAPGRLLRAEQLHLRLVQLRKREAPGEQGIDRLFGIDYSGPGGKYQPGQLDEAERKQLPSDAVAQVQQLALWLPGDARLLWQMAELAAAHGDVITAAAMMDGCVTELGLRSEALRQHRMAMRAAADERARAGASRAGHEGHLGALRTRSARPLASRVDREPMPPIDPKAVNRLPWSVVTETVLDKRFRPTFPKYLQELNGLQVSMTGFMQPLGDELECVSFMLIEFPVGCWFCEMPELSGIVLAEMPVDRSQTYSRDLLRVTGKLQLNATDPEGFLYILRDVTVTEAR